MQDEHGFAPFICAGPNGSGKSNLLEALAAIFYHLECIYLEDLPESFLYEEETNRNGFRGEKAAPDGFEIEYLIWPKDSDQLTQLDGEAHVRIVKKPGEPPKWSVLNHNSKLTFDQTLARQLLPEYILAYSSGENEILSLPFFKMRFIQYDEYWQALTQQLPYPGRPESSLVYLDSGFSQAILLCNLLFQDNDSLAPFRDDVKLDQLKEFRIIVKRSIELDKSLGEMFGSLDPSTRDSLGQIAKSHPALIPPEDQLGSDRYHANLLQLLEGHDDSIKIISALKRCSTCWYLDEEADTLYLDYRVNTATREAFQSNFSNDPLELFQAFRVLLTLNLFASSAELKRNVYQSTSLYVSDTVPTLGLDERIVRFENLWVAKTDVDEPVLLKSLSDGEHQLLHTLGLCMLFRNTQSLFLLDEPETHFNPDWRANLVTRLYECFSGENEEPDRHGREMLITTHAPFLVSDSKPEKVLVFEKVDDAVKVSHPDYNTLGASINKITMSTFGKRETIGGHAQKLLDNLRDRFKQGENKDQLLDEITHQFGDSVEKMLLLKTILESEDKAD